MTRPESDYTQNADGTWREKTAAEKLAEYQAGRGAGKTAQGPRLKPPKRAPLVVIGQRRQVKVERVFTKEAPPRPGEGRAHCPASQVSKQARGLEPNHADRYQLAHEPEGGPRVVVLERCTGCGDVLFELDGIGEPAPWVERTRKNRSRKHWRRHRRKHGKLKRGW